MNYSSLAILSRCPQAPIPNLGQYDHQSFASSAPNVDQNDHSHVSASVDQQRGVDSSVTDVSSAGVYSAQRSTYPPPNVPAASMTVQPALGQYVPTSDVSPAAGPGSVVSDNVADLSLSSGLIDDDFDDFKTAPTSLTAGDVLSSYGL